MLTRLSSLALCFVIACSSESTDEGTSGGAAGSPGTAGSTSSAGSSGAGGATASAGAAGSSGSAGAGGQCGVYGADCTVACCAGLTCDGESSTCIAPAGDTLVPGEVCGTGDAQCAPGLACCYPCGVGGCERVCEVACDPSTPGCAGGCMMMP